MVKNKSMIEMKVIDQKWKQSNSHFDFDTSHKFFPKSKCSNSPLQFAISHKFFPNCKRSQVTVFIILAIVIVLGVILYFVFRGSLTGVKGVPKELKPVYEYYLSCVEEDVTDGARILGEQAGYIETPDFVSGSSYMPFSSQLNFLGIPVPYWYYISGNNIIREQVPTKGLMQDQLDGFLEKKINDCDFSEFSEQGFEIEISKEASVQTKIEKTKIEVNIEQELKISSGNNTWQGKEHFYEVDSSLGIFYETSKKIYEHFKKTMFLETYGVDILRLYAPVDGTEISCSPKIWNIGEIRNNLTQALEANTGFIKIKGDYYELTKEENKYFVQNIGEEVDANVNFLYLREWPMKLEVWPSEDGLLVAEPVGLDEGMGMLGFCYVPYHFVYELAYPVLMQIYYENEMFQFPVVVYINKNKPREPLETEGLPKTVPELCEHKNTELSVYSYNKDLEPVEAKIEFKCFDTSCDIGRTRISENDAVLTARFPQCVNGYLIARAEGYETAKQVISSVSEGSVSIFLDKKYELEVEIEKNGQVVGGNDYAVVIFNSNDTSKTINYPDMKNIELTEGQYEIKTYIYSNVDINLQGSSNQKCIELPKSGLFGVFGITEEKCFDVNIPGQNIEFAVSGGGTQSHYISESELESAEKIIINTDSFGVPAKIEDIQLNYENIENSGLDVRFE